MNSSEAVSQLKTIIREWRELSGKAPSAELMSFVNYLENEILTKSVKAGAKKRSKKPRDPVHMANTIREITQKLEANFDADEAFEASIQQLEPRAVTKDIVVGVYNELFSRSKTFPSRTTKSALIKAIRKDRIAKLRAS